MTLWQDGRRLARDESLFYGVLLYLICNSMILLSLLLILMLDFRDEITEKPAI